MRPSCNAQAAEKAPSPPQSLLTVLATLDPLDEEFPLIPELAVDAVEF